MSDHANNAERSRKRTRPVVLPRWLRATALYCVCFLAIAGAAYVLARALSKLYPVVLAVVVAVFLAALTAPVARWLRGRRLPRPLAALTAVSGGVVLVLGGVTLFGVAVAGNASALADRAGSGVREIRDWLVDGPLHISPAQLNAIIQEAGRAFAPTSLRGAATGLEVVVSAVLGLMLLFFMLMDAASGWRWALRGLPAPDRDRVDRAGRAGWRTLTGYVRGIVVVAAVDAVGTGVALALLRVPLAVPLAAMTFFFCFVPFLGATLAGALCVLVALGARGPGVAVLVLAAVIIVQLAEGRYLEPLIMGRASRPHRVVVLLAVTVGALLAGVGGALLSVPLVAVAYRAFVAFRENPHPTPIRPPLGRRMPPDAEARPVPSDG